MKKISFKKTKIITALLSFISVTVLFMNSCKVSQKVAMRSGAQLWTENCQRCHNTPSPSTFSPEQWETIGLHMQSRALLTNKERDKIIEFMKQ
ncbi:cytochrome c [Asinibacterium sp. OR53]|uniref:c-type cytochrome n=1 Tax=Asinibacterium sp. OR53 TaxID=925409 RepID=UPI0004229D1C|nr:cytochrome c [Asinibacterium sp. OR53]